jgi:hypothetical protein
MSDIVDKLKAERDKQAVLRRQAFVNDDIVAANAHDALCGLLGEAIRDLEKSHVIIGVMKDVMMKRIVEAAVGEAYRERLE